MTIRETVRRVVPAPILLRRRLWLRALADRRSGIRFAARRAVRENEGLCEWSRYSLPIIDYPGQEDLATAKRQNQVLLASALDGVAILPGETFSVWRLAGRPTARAGYAPAAALRDGRLSWEPGGAICLLSTVLYNAALLAATDITERSCHSVDSYGDRRYFELGRDAAIEYGYLDLRFRNPHDTPLLLRVEADEDHVEAELLGTRPRAFCVALQVSEPQPVAALPGDSGRYRVHTTRLVSTLAGARRDDLGWSMHRVP